jgi:hypothetical protein
MAKQWQSKVIADLRWDFPEYESKKQLIVKLRQEKERIDKSIQIMSSTPSRLPKKLEEDINAALTEASQALMMWIYELVIG